MWLPPPTYHIRCCRKSDSHPCLCPPLHDKVEKSFIILVCVDSNKKRALGSLAPGREGGSDTEGGVMNLEGRRGRKKKSEEGREEGREGGRKGGRKEGREEGREGGREEGGRKGGGRKGGRKEGREEGKEGGRKGGRKERREEGKEGGRKVGGRMSGREEGRREEGREEGGRENLREDRVGRWIKEQRWFHHCYDRTIILL